MIGNALILFIIGLLLIILVLGQHLLDGLEDQFTFQLELQDNLNEKDIDQIKMMLSQLDYIDHGTVKFKDRQQIAREFQKDLGLSTSDKLMEEALFDAISFKLVHRNINSADVIRAKSEIMKIPLVTRVNHIEDLSKGLFDNMESMRILGFILSVVLCIILTILIYNNTRLSIYSERFKIRKMQLVGAIPWIIIKPFVVSAIRIAFFATCISVLGISALLYLSNARIETLNSFEAWTILAKVSVFLLLISTTISIVSSYVIVNRYLRMDLDDLYR